MVDSAALRQRRKRRHRVGDHTLCSATRCALAGRVERDDVRSLRDAVEREFGGDEMRLQLARAGVELVARGGPQAATALRDLNQTIEAKRRGQLAPAVSPTIDDQVQADAEEYVRWTLAERLDRLEAEVDLLRWPAVLAGVRAELGVELGELGGREARRG